MVNAGSLPGLVGTAQELIERRLHAVEAVHRIVGQTSLKVEACLAIWAGAKRDGSAGIISIGSGYSHQSGVWTS